MNVLKKCTVCFALLLFSMSTQLDARIVTDMTGRQVNIPEDIKRIASPYRVATEMLLVLGVADRIVGVPTMPSKVARVFYPQLAHAGIANRHSSVEEVLKMNPDIVFTSPGPLVQGLDDAGVAAFCIVVEDPDAMIRGLYAIADVLDRKDRADGIARYYKDKLSYITQRTSGISPKSKVYLIGARTLTTVGGDFYQHHIIELAGGINVSRDLRGGWVPVSREHLIAWDPDLIVTLPYYEQIRRSDLLEDKALAPLRAIRNRRIHTFPTYIDSWDLPSPESILGIMWMANTIYPGKVNFDMKKEAGQFYTRFYGQYPVEIELGEKEGL